MLPNKHTTKSWSAIEGEICLTSGLPEHIEAMGGRTETSAMSCRWDQGRLNASVVVIRGT